MAKINIWNYRNGSVLEKAPKFIHYPFGHIVRSSFSKKYFENANLNLSDEINHNKKIKVLDIGTYKIHNLYPFHIRGCKLFGTAVNKYDLTMSKKIAKKNGCSVQIKIGQNRKLPFKKNFFDYVMSINTLHYEESIANVKKALIEFKRVCKNNGIVTIDMPTKKYFFFKKCKKIKKNIYKYINKNDFRNNSIFFYFDNEVKIKKVFSKFFKTVEIAKITEKYPKLNLEWYHIKCVK